MAALARSHVSLRIFGDHLLRADVTRMLGCDPTEAWQKGDVKKSKSGRDFVRKTGAWFLRAEHREPADLEAQVAEILGKLSSDPQVWSSLNQKFKVDLFCGWFMTDSNEGVSISPATMGQLQKRGIVLALDIYGPDKEQP